MEREKKFYSDENIGEAQEDFDFLEEAYDFPNSLSIREEVPIEDSIEDIRGESYNFTAFPEVYDSSPKDKEQMKKGIESLSIIIPALNEEHYLPKLLNSLVKQEFNSNLQVIVVDGKSNDDTAKVARRYENNLDLQVISSERGTGLQRNKGVASAKYDHLLFLDADVIVPKNMLNQFTSKIDSSERIVDTVVIIPHPLKLVDTVGGMYGNLILGLINKFEPAMTGAFLLTTKENHQKVGGFAEGAIIGVDLDYVLRSARDGAKTHKHMNNYVFSSARRGDQMGRFNFARAWAKAYLYVRKHGPIYDNFDYPYGNYKK